MQKMWKKREKFVFGRAVRVLEDRCVCCGEVISEG